MADSGVAKAYAYLEDFREYTRTNKKNRSLIGKIRSHLFALGWKIDCSQVKGQPHYSYTSPSPDGKIHYSLKKLCQELLDSSVPLASVEQDDVFSYFVDSPMMSDGLFLVEQANVGEPPSHQDLGDLGTIPEYGLESERYALPDVELKPECLPQAVKDWYTLTEQDNKPKGQSKFDRDLSLKAKKHLRYLGWNIWYNQKGSKRELRYTSPKTDETGPNDNTMQLQSHMTTKPRRLGKSKRESLCEDDEVWMMSESDESDFTWVEPDERAKKQMLPSKIVRKVENDQSETSSASPSQVQNPRRRTIVTQLIEDKVILPEAPVYYLVGNSKRTGRIVGRGIKCDCCGVEFTLSKFETHIGSTKHRPAANIFLEDGRSLLTCQREALKQKKGSIKRQRRHGDDDQNTNNSKFNDNVCSVCQFGGDIILCDRCPSSFHPGCIGLTKIPDGDWFCPSCCCKICRQAKYMLEDSPDACVDNEFLYCGQCERNFHAGCVRDSLCFQLRNYPDGKWYCCEDCEKISSGLQNLVGKTFYVGEDNLTCTLLKNAETGFMENMTQIESKLNVAVKVMHECFEPAKDAFSGRDLVEDVIFSRSSELNRLNFRGFFTAILEKNNQVVTVATVRILGKKVAEVPLVATKFKFRRRGMCRVLMDELEKKLSEFGVERLVLPAAPTVLNTWTNSFGFATMTNSERAEFLDYTFLDFQDTIKCHKELKKPMVAMVESEGITGSLGPYFDTQSNIILPSLDPFTEACLFDWRFLEEQTSLV